MMSFVKPMVSWWLCCRSAGCCGGGPARSAGAAGLSPRPGWQMHQSTLPELDRDDASGLLWSSAQGDEVACQSGQPGLLHLHLRNHRWDAELTESWCLQNAELSSQRPFSLWGFIWIQLNSIEFNCVCFVMTGNLSRCLIYLIKIY